jgi:hypothetical protein
MHVHMKLKLKFILAMALMFTEISFAGLYNNWSGKKYKGTKSKKIKWAEEKNYIIYSVYFGTVFK